MSVDRWRWVVPMRLRTVFRRAEVERELDEELAYHVEMQTVENIRAGMLPQQARAAALRSLGGVDQRKEQVRDTRGLQWLEGIARDLGFAVRNLRRAPGFTAAVVLTLALGIGANTAMFTLLRGTLLRPLPHEDSGRLVYLRQSAEGAGAQNLSFSVPELGDVRSQSRTLASIAEYSSLLPFPYVGSDGIPRRVRAGVVSGNYFDVLGLSPVAGRIMSRADDGATAESVVVLTHEFWMQHYGGDRDVVGSTVRINDMPATIIGVVEPAPDYPEPVDVFVNIVTSPHHLDATMVTERTHRMTELFARLAPGVTVEQAQEELAAIAGAMKREHPDAYGRAEDYRVTVTPLRDAVNERAAQMFWLLMAAAVFVLLIACANVSNLTLMRGVGREREMLVRAALGAGRTRLRRLLLAENLLLALLGGALGIAVALAGTRLLVAFASQLSPRASEIRVDGVVLAVGLATSVIVAIALSFVPRLTGNRAVASSLTPSGRRATLGRAGQRLQRSLVIAQLAVCAVLLTGAGLLMRTLAKLQAVDTGVSAEHVLTVSLPMDGRMDASVMMRQPELLARYDRIRAHVATLPGVSTAALGSVLPLRRSLVDFDVKAEGITTPPDQPQPHAILKTVDPDYFRAAGIPVLQGRAFASTDVRGAARVVVLNRTLARQLFGDANPLGRRVAWTGEVLKFSPISGAWRTVVGVVGDTRDAGLDREPAPTMYEPFAQEVVFGAVLLARSAGDPQMLRSAVVSAIREVEPRQLIEDVATLEQVRDETVAPRRLNALFITSFSTLALLIATVGIAGVLAFSVSSRTPEIGIRMSVGADATRVRRMVLGEGGVLLIAGLGIGLVGALLAARLIRGMLFGVTPYDPATLAAVALLLGGVGVAACWVPAARAARVDPAVALRAD